MRKIVTSFSATALVFSLIGLSGSVSANPAGVRDANTSGVLMFQPTTIKEARSIREAAFAEATTKKAFYQEKTDTVEGLSEELVAAWGQVESAESSVNMMRRSLDDAQNAMDALVRGIYMSGTSVGIGGGFGFDILFMDLSDTDSNIGSALEAQQFAEAGARDVASKVDLARVQLTAAESQYEEAVRAHVVAGEVLFEAVREQNAAWDAFVAAENYAVFTSEQFKEFIRQYRPSGSDAELLPVGDCQNWLVKVLYNAGFRGEDLREAWAIAMRESGGRDDAISYTNDYGIFQFNKATWQYADWWDEEALLDRHYNVAIAFQMSDGGRTWYPWGLDGKGRPKTDVYARSGWDEGRIISQIIEPYERWYNQYPCVAEVVPE